MTIVVTRHAGLVQYLLEEGIIDWDFYLVDRIDDSKEIWMEDVVGVLPLHLAAFCRSLTVVNLDTPNELRGAELSVEQIRQYVRDIRTYKVEDTSAIHKVERALLSAFPEEKLEEISDEYEEVITGMCDEDFGSIGHINVTVNGEKFRIPFDCTGVYGIKFIERLED